MAGRVTVSAAPDAPGPDADPRPLATRALRALLAPDTDSVLVADASADHVDLPGVTLAEPALARRLRESGAAVVVAHTPGPTLLRALRERPPALLVLTGPADPDGLPHLPQTLLLGPDARLRLAPVPTDSLDARRRDRPAPAPTDSFAEPVPTDSPSARRHERPAPAPTDSFDARRRDRAAPIPADSPDKPVLSDSSDRPVPTDSHDARRHERPAPVPLDSVAEPVPADSPIVACATAPDALAALLAALATATARPVRLAACPTPAWWPAWLADPRLAGCTAVGFVAAEALGPDWARWAAAQPPGAHVLVPLGLGPARVDVPRDPSLAAAVAAHALERWTGPVFPDPAVLALLAAPPADTRAPTPADRATWTQAGRALPLLGAASGMAAPQPGLALAAPTAAFLAQRSLLRRARTQDLAREPDPPSPQLDDAAVARAEEVLRSAGQVLSEHESKVVLRGFGVEITRQAVANSASGAAQYAEQIGWPVVLKALSPDLRRKADVGAVVLGLTTAAAVRRAYATILASVEQHAPTARIDGVLVAEQAADGLEIEVGAVRLAGDLLAVYGRPLGLAHAAEPTLALSPLRPRDARLLADAVLARVPGTALRRASDPGVPELAALFLRLDALLRHFEPDLSPGTAPPDEPGRLVSVELGPIRLVGPPRGYLTLDARIVQRPHLEGL